MATKLIKVGNSFNVPQKSYICNTIEERDELKAYFGDLALVIEDGITYILNSEGDWYVYPTGGGGGDVASEAIAPVYDPVETAYQTNELIMYDGKLWRAKQAILAPAGDFDETKWEQVDVASAKADLIDGKVPASQLPSYVDDVLEYANRAAFPQQGESGKIYVAIDTGYTYRWSGSEYIAIGTIYNEVHIGPNAPTGDETIWIKPEGRNQSTDTIDSKEVGDWLYLDETVNGVTSQVRFKIISKNTDTNTAILAREGTTTPGFKVDVLDVEPIYDGDYDDAIMAQYNQNVRTNSTLHALTFSHTSVPQEDRDPDPREPREKYGSFYNGAKKTEDVNDLLVLKVDNEGGNISFILPSINGASTGTQCSLFYNFSKINTTLFESYGYNNLYIAVALEVPLDTLLVGFDASIDPYANYTLKFKQNGQWNDLDDLRIATVAQLLALENRVIDLEGYTHIAAGSEPPTDTNVLWLDTSVEGE